MNKIFITSDLYLGDDAVVGRSEGATKRLLNEWDNVVFPKDVVIVLGNLSRSAAAYWMGAIRRLPGVKIFVRGVRDPNRTSWYEKKGFDLVHEMDEAIFYPATMFDEFSQLMLTSIPVFQSVEPDEIVRNNLGRTMNRLENIFDIHNCVLNLHGSSRGNGHEKTCTVDVSPETTSFRLNTLQQHIARWKENVSTKQLDRRSL